MLLLLLAKSEQLSHRLSCSRAALGQRERRPGAKRRPVGAGCWQAAAAKLQVAACSCPFCQWAALKLPELLSGYSLALPALRNTLNAPNWAQLCGSVGESRLRISAAAGNTIRLTFSLANNWASPAAFGAPVGPLCCCEGHTLTSTEPSRRAYQFMASSPWRKTVCVCCLSERVCQWGRARSRHRAETVFSVGPNGIVCACLCVPVCQ